MERVEVTNRSELSDGDMIVMEIDGRTVVLAQVKDDYFAIQGLCTNKEGKLWEGELNEWVIKCPRHGSEFDLRTGEVQKGPWIPFAKAERLKTYQVAVEGDKIFLELEDSF